MKPTVNTESLRQAIEATDALAAAGRDATAALVDAGNACQTLAQGLTVEQMCALFFDVDALIEPPYKTYQVNARGTRFYYVYDDDGTPQFYPSVTTILGRTLPTEPHLVKWIANKGYEEAERFKGERAAYGTFMHGQYAELLINRRYDLDGLTARLAAYIEREGLPADFIMNAADLKSDMLAFTQWIVDYDVRPIAIEVAMIHPTKGYAGMIDLVCTMRSRIGCDERITAIVDFKSGRKGFHKEHELQLAMYRDMWCANFPATPIDRVYNFAPKEWRKAPSYHLKDQTNSKAAGIVPHLIAIYYAEDDSLKTLYTNIGGVIDLTEQDPLHGTYELLPLQEMIERHRQREQTPDNA